MKKITMKQRLKYEFDNTMSRGTPALIGWLAIVSLALIVLVSAVVLITGIGPQNEGQPLDFIGLMWSSFLHTLDSGYIEGDTGVPFVTTMFIVTLGGILIVSTLIGVLTTGISNKIEHLRKGRSLVVERNHTIVLGWSTHVFSVLHELAVANANQRHACVVVMADRDKVEMEDEIRDKVGHTGRMRVVCRTGSPIDMVDLEIVNLNDARSIIVLSPDDEEPDSQVIKTILAITNNRKRRPHPYHIVGEIHDPSNLEAAHLVGGDEAQILEVGDIISRLTVQISRQSGLSVVYTELMDFEGDEIYLQEEPALVGKTFGDALLAYEDSSLIGLDFKDKPLKLNPPMDTVIAPGDRVIAISEDDDTVKLSGLTDLKIDFDAIMTPPPTPRIPERTLLLGWNRRATSIISELDDYVAPDSTVTVVADSGDAAAEIAARCADLRNLTVEFRQGDIVNRATLEALGVGQYQHVIVLCYSDFLDPQRADARTLITLLHLRDMEAKLGEMFSIVSEMLDDRNRQLASVTEADDFIVSDKLISLLMAQISENRHLREVFADLFASEGSELYLRPAADYVRLDRPINFYTVVESARRRGYVAVGYRLHVNATDPEKAYGVVVNPDKPKTITFTQADRIIVLAEE
jgi:voltage-gated potassium channel Kch